MLDFETIGRRIKFYRNKAALTQAELAEELDVSSNYVSQIERGATLSMQRLNEIAEHIHVKVEYLLADANDSSPDFLNAEILERISDWSPEDKILLIHIVEAIQKTRDSGK